MLIALAVVVLLAVPALVGGGALLLAVVTKPEARTQDMVMLGGGFTVAGVVAIVWMIAQLRRFTSIEVDGNDEGHLRNALGMHIGRIAGDGERTLSVFKQERWNLSTAVSAYNSYWAEIQTESRTYRSLYGSHKTLQSACDALSPTS